MPRVTDHRRIKRHRNYTVDEAARTLGVAKGTVRRWIKKGLPVLFEQRPMLILGGDLIDFLVARARPKQRCALHECFCFSCREPRSPAFDAIEYHSLSATSGNLRALCSACATVMHKRLSVSKLDALKQILEVTIVEGQRPLSEIDDPCVNDHLDKELETMRKHHPKNERIKRQYLAYLEEAKRKSVKSTDQVAAAIAAFEASTGYKDFAQFHIEQARKFKRDLANAINPKTGRPLAKATIRSRLMHVKAFIHWLAGQPGFKSRISYSDAEYFNPSANDTRIATASRERPVPSIEQIRHVILSSPAETDIEKRDRALIAFTLLTGARDDAIASLSIKHVDLQARTVFQDAREVRTKNRKTFTTWFFPIGDDIEAIVRDWIKFLTKKLMFGPDDPLFPATEIGLDKDGHFAPIGLKRAHWKTASPIRDILRRRFEAAGLSYFHPHSFRKTLARLGTAMTTTTEEWAAWSQNLGHEDVKTTFQSYAKVPRHRQAEIFRSLSAKTDKRRADRDEPDQETIARVLEHLQKKT